MTTAEKTVLEEIKSLSDQLKEKIKVLENTGYKIEYHYSMRGKLHSLKWEKSGLVTF